MYVYSIKSFTPSSVLTTEAMIATPDDGWVAGFSFQLTTHWEVNPISVGHGPLP